MLSRAVRDHDASQPKKAPLTLSQQLFPSSSPSSGQPPVQPLQRPPTLNGALRPTSSTTVNSAKPSFPPYKNPLKRSASELRHPGLSSTDGSQTFRAAVGRPTAAAPIVDRPLGVLGKLHEDVTFDDNAFPNDSEIDLDGDDSGLPFVQPKPPESTPHLKRNASVTARTPETSQPIPWSSSPLEHKVAVPRKADVGRSGHGRERSPAPKPFLDTISSKAADDGRRELEVIDLEAEDMASTKPPPASSSRRKIPWLDKSGNEVEMVHASGGPTPEIQRAIEKKRKEKEARAAQARASQTPKEKSMPWNKTASAMKEEQKRLQQESKTRKRSRDIAEEADESRQGAEGSKKKKNSREKFFLSDEQRKVLDLVVEDGKSVFFTGSAGTGKSVLMREIIAALRTKYRKDGDRVAVTASTGLAACNVGGVTLHSFAGIGLGREPAEDLVKRIKKNMKTKQRWQRTKVLVIDEISMVDGDLFDKLEAIARVVRNNGRPFGGIQLVITGDFFQLPPVPDSQRQAKFAFDAQAWATSIGATIGLSHVFRQKDPVFANMLNEMRLGKLSPHTIRAFQALSRPLNFDDEIQATELFPTRNEVDLANNVRMKQLVGEAKDFVAIDSGNEQDIERRTKLLSNCMAPERITLKKGAQVMLIKNMDETLVNGSIGQVRGFMDEATFEHYRENEEDFYGSGQQDVTAQRRSKLLALLGENSANTARKWPLVRFALSDGSHREMLLQSETWKIELPNGEVQAQRSQVPLILAWALSIHKAQGQTLDRVKVDLGRAFEKGQAYVALSRATTQHGLQVTRFNPKIVQAHDRVRRFYESLYSIDTVPAKSAASTATTKTSGKPVGRNSEEMLTEVDYEVMQESGTGW